MIPIGQWLEHGTGVEVHPPPTGVAVRKPDTEAAIDSILAEQYQRGVMEGAADAQRRCAAEFEAERQTLLTSFAAERRLWQMEDAAQLLKRTDDSLIELRATIERQVAAIIRPFLIDQVRNQALAAFADLLSENLQRQMPHIAMVSAPQTLHEALTVELAERGLPASITSVEGDECLTTLGDENFETCIRDWLLAIDGYDHE